MFDWLKTKTVNATIEVEKKDDECQHENMSEQSFHNRQDIKFMRCEDCGEKKYPEGFVKVNEGKTVTIVWKA